MPALLKNHTVKARFSRHIAAGFLHCAARRSRHIRGLKVLDDDYPVRRSYFARLDVVEVLPDARCLGLRGGQSLASLKASVASPFGSSECPGVLSRAAIEKSKPSHRLVSKRAIGQRECALHAAINANGRINAGGHVVLDFASKAYMPTQIVVTDGNVSESTYDIPRPSKPNPANLRQSNAAPITIKALNNDLAALKSECIVHAFSPGFWITRAAREKAGIGGVKVPESLLLTGLAHIAYKIVLASQIRQLAALTWHADTLAVNTPKGAPMIAALLKSEIVDQADHTGELPEKALLRIGGVQPVTKSAVDHRTRIPFFGTKTKRLGELTQ